MICPECGRVVGERIVDVGTEWRSFSDESGGNDPSRVGAPQSNLFSGELSTTFYVGTGATEAEKSLANVQRKTKSSHDRTMGHAMSVIREMSERIHINKSIQEQAMKIFADMLESKRMRGRSAESQAAACLYFACRMQNAPRTFIEICTVARQPKKEISRCYKIIRNTLDNNLELITSADFMSRFCGNLELPNYVQVAATRIAKKAVELDLVAGRSPISIAAAAIYMASQASSEKRTAKEIGDVAGVAEITVRQAYRLFLPRAAELFPPDFKFDTGIHDLPNS